MAHVRTQIRLAVAAMLADMPTTGDRVHATRLYSLDENELPSVSVFTTDDSNPETINKITLGQPVKLHRDMPLIIEGHALVDEDADRVLDDIACEVEKAMSADLIVQGRPLQTRLLSTQTQFTSDGEMKVGLVRMTYTIAYVTSETTPDSLISL